MVIRKRKLNKSLVWFSVLFSISLVIAPFGARGAILYLEPSSGEYYQDDVFLVEVRLDTEGEAINAMKVDLGFPSEILEIKDFSKGNSILTLWVEEPKFSNDEISFAGGVPGGYWGPDGLLARIAFRARGTTQIVIQNNAEIKILDSSKVLLNDGKGTEAELITKEAVFTILAEKLEVPKDEWKEEVEEDKILPEPFKVEISQDPSVFEGKYFITFSTTDKQTGIDHYEVKEGKGGWKIAISPYVLENQKLTSDIWVRAIDKAGNEWIEIVKASYKPTWKYVLYLIAVLIIIIIIGVIWVILKRIITKQKRNHEH